MTMNATCLLPMTGRCLFSQRHCEARKRSAVDGPRRAAVRELGQTVQFGVLNRGNRQNPTI